jgi:hypothetical protein
MLSSMMDQSTPCGNRLREDFIASKIMKIQLDLSIEQLPKSPLKLNKCPIEHSCDSYIMLNCHSSEKA